MVGEAGDVQRGATKSMWIVCSRSGSAPRSHIVYFHSVKARWRRTAAKFCSVQVGRKPRQAASKASAEHACLRGGRPTCSSATRRRSRCCHPSRSRRPALSRNNRLMSRRSQRTRQCPHTPRAQGSRHPRSELPHFVVFGAYPGDCVLVVSLRGPISRAAPACCVAAPGPATGVSRQPSRPGCVFVMDRHRRANRT